MHDPTFLAARRRFLTQLALAGAGLLGARDLRALDRLARHLPRGTRVRVRGRVTSAGRPLRRVAVTDGLTVVETDAEGRYELTGVAEQPFVYVTIPAGHEIPRNAAGTARFYEPLRFDARGEASASFELTPLRRDDREHAMLLLADPQTQNRTDTALLHAQTVPDVRETVRTLGDLSVFGVACGDIMYDDLSLYPEWERAVTGMGVPFFQVVGNHDLDFKARTDEGTTATFERHFGPRYYSFERGVVHYVVLDDVLWHGTGYVGYLDQAQLHWLQQDLARVERGRPVVVLLHIPAVSTLSARRGVAPSTGESLNNRDALDRLLEGHRAITVAGHTHEHEVNGSDRLLHVVTGAVCGGWWTGPICYDGTPNGYGVFEVKGEEVRWRYKATGRDANHQLRAYARGADLKAPDEIVTNVWGWDPTWTVVWYEDGARRGAMARRPGLDPLSVELHAGPDKPERRRWVDPIPTRHLFYAPVSPGTRDVRVEVVDRFGRTYSAPVPTRVAG